MNGSMALIFSNFFLVPIRSSCCHRTALMLMMVLQRQQQQQHNPFSNSWNHGSVTSLGSDPTEEWSRWNVLNVSLQLPVECLDVGLDQRSDCSAFGGDAGILGEIAPRPVLVFLADVSPAFNFHVRGQTSQVQVWQTGKGY